MRHQAYSDTVALLMATRILLSDEKQWIKSAAARDAFGDIIMPDNPRAVSWCLAGATDAFGSGVRLQCKALRAIAGIVPDGIMAFNDGSSHADVLRCLDKAIEATL